MDLSFLLAGLGPPGQDQGIPRQQRLYHLLKEGILGGVLPAGCRLPASRTLAEEWGLARNSVLFAYEQLLAEGFLVADRRGTRVASLALPSGSGKKGPANASPAAGPGLARRAEELVSRSGALDALPFTPGVPDLNAFPWPVWARFIQRAWGEVTARQLAYAAPGGEAVLRQAIATHLGARRGVVCRPEQVIITAGAQSALDACARLLADPGDAVWLENPGYPAARAVMAAAGLKMVNMPVDGEGMAPTAECWEKHPPRLVFLTPSHQYPLGGVMGLGRRLDLLARAGQAGAWIIEDDYDSEFSHGPGALTALQGLAPEAAVVYVGTFSKLLYPGLRIGYMVLPPWAATAMAEKVAALARPGQAVEQRALARFLDSGRLTAHLRRMLPRYRARRQILAQELEARLGSQGEVLGGRAGLHLAFRFREVLDDRAVVARAAHLGVSARPLSGYYAPGGPVCQGLVLGYGLAEEALIPELVARLAAAVGKQ